jgi:phosphotransferase system enzyme I (PtsI)
VHEFIDKVVFEGLPVSGGIGIGKLICVKDTDYEVNSGLIDETQVESQITDLEVAICKTFIEIYDLKDGFKGLLSDEENRIFEFYSEILDDSFFFEEIKNVIRQDRYHADNAIYKCIQGYIDCIQESDNEYVKNRIFDLNDVRKRLIKNVYGDSEVNFDNIDSSQIVVVRELNPIIAGVLSKKEVKGVVAEEGAGYFTHASIILKSVGIPTLGNVNFKELVQYRDNNAVIDCNKGILIINPDNNQIFNYNEKLKGKDSIKNSHYFEPAITTDGHKVSLYASISSLKEFNIAKRTNFDGIGLVRTESIFINYSKVPDEKRQFAIYAKMAKTMKNRMIVLRTADIGGDKVPGIHNLYKAPSENNPRGIKRSLDHKNEFVLQMRSIVRANAYGNVGITFPMVTSADEIREVKKIIRDIEADPSVKNNERIKIGAFIETISAVNDINNIIEEVDFINIGTNDLLHQFCGLNRKCSTILKENYLDPEFIKMVKWCVDSAKRRNKPVVVCGEMASDPISALVLLGLGVKDLSLTLGAFYDIYELIGKVNCEDAEKIAEKVVQSQDISEVKKILSDWLVLHTL